MKNMCHAQTKEVNGNELFIIKLSYVDKYVNLDNKIYLIRQHIVEI